MKLHNYLLHQPRIAGMVLLAAGVALEAGAANPPYQTTVQSQGPVGYWRLNETTLPLPYTVMATNIGSLGSSANGTYNSDATRGLAGPFTGSTAISLNGISQSVTTPWQAGLNTSAFSFEAWVNPAVVPNFAYVASSVQTTSPRSGWYLAQDNNSTFGLGNGFVLRMFYQDQANPSITLFATNDLPLGSWYHLVITFDGTTATLYKNGVVAQSGQPLGYVPNVNAQFSVGVRSDNGFYWPGEAAEVASYSAALTATQVAAHFAAATTNSAGYGTQILADSPNLYWRFREPADPVAGNIGSLGTAADGRYVYPARPGIAGPRPALFPGFEANNTAVAFDGTGGNVALKNLNLDTNTVTITCWVNLTNVQAASAGIVFCRTANTTAGLTIDPVYAGYGLGYNWGGQGIAWSPQNDSGLPPLPDSGWAFAALVVQPSQAALFLCDANNFANFTGATNTPVGGHAVQLFDGPTLIGADTSTNALNGAVDEVSIFNRALSTGEVYSQYATAVGSVPPRIFYDPQTPLGTVYAGDPLQLTVDAGGSPTVTYQWRRNSSPISGATLSAYTVASLSTSDSGTYDCVVTNNYGSATSGQASVNVNTVTAPVITLEPVGRTLFPGGTLNLTVQAVGGQLRYQWKTNGTPIAGATNSTYAVASVTSGNAGNYVVTVSNSAGTIDSTPAATINVVNLTAGSYEAVIAADAPVSLWRLDETSLNTMFDAFGHNDGYYTNTATLGAPGALVGDPDTAVTGDGSAAWFGVVPYSGTLGSSDFTLECWAKVPDSSANYCPVSFYDSVSKHGDFYYSDAGAGAWRAAIGAGTDPYLFYYLGDTPFANIVPNQWMHLVITYAGSGANSGLRCYVNGQWGGNVYGNFNRNLSAPLLIGGIGAAINYPMKGSVDEVAFYTHALSQAQIQAHYNAAVYPTPTPPVFTFQPASQAMVVGQSTTLNALAQGTSPITYQWYHNGAALAGQTANTLALNNITFAGFGGYQVIASNSVATTPSAVAKITVAPLPTFVNATNGLVLHLPFDGSYNDSSGSGDNASPVGSPTFVAGKIGSGAFHFNTDTTLGVYNYATLGATIPANLLFSSNTNFSVAYWVRLPAGALPGDLPFLCSAVGSTFSSGLTFAPSYKVGGWAWSLNGTGVYGANASINDGNWHSLVHTFDRTANGLTYLDGVLVNSTGIASVGDVDTGGAMNIGQDPTGSYGESGAMDLDDLGVWNRVLSASEATAVYYAGTHGTSFDTYGPVTVYLTPTPGGFIVSWQAGTLMHSSSVTGPWTPVTGAAAPNYSVTIGATNQFFKVKL